MIERILWRLFPGTMANAIKETFADGYELGSCEGSEYPSGWEHAKALREAWGMDPYNADSRERVP